MPVGSVVHALRILRHLADARHPEGVTAIARQLGISPSSCFNLLRTLSQEDFLSFDPALKTYSIGPELARLARRGEGEDPVVRSALPLMQELASRFRIASGLWRLAENKRLVLVASADSDLATRLHMTLGQRLPMLIGAIGRCVGAHSTLSEGQLKEGFAQLRWERTPSFARYKREVAAARRSGWAIDDGDFMRGLTTIAAPVLDRRGAVKYCVANTLFQGQFEQDEVNELASVTAGLALQIADFLKR
jgi:DNA-binding IclR family transcriptional regulator